MYILNCPGCENEGIYLIGTIENKDGTTDDLFMCDACGTEGAGNGPY